MPAINHLSGPDSEIFGLIRELQQQVKDLANRNPFTGTNINMDDTGHLTVGGLQLLAVSPSFINQAASGYAVNATSTIVVSATVSVPAGYTQAIIFTSGTLGYMNSTASPQYGQGSTLVINSSNAQTIGSSGPVQYLPAMAEGTMAVGSAGIFTGLSGGTITMNGYQYATAAFAASGFNFMRIGASIIFLA